LSPRMAKPVRNPVRGQSKRRAGAQALMYLIVCGTTEVVP
jgi:hypothetical protein